MGVNSKTAKQSKDTKRYTTDPSQRLGITRNLSWCGILGVCSTSRNGSHGEKMSVRIFSLVSHKRLASCGSRAVRDGSWTSPKGTRYLPLYASEFHLTVGDVAAKSDVWAPLAGVKADVLKSGRRNEESGSVEWFCFAVSGMT
jgi:hypothetical protein